MPKRSSYVTRFILLMGLCILGMSVLFYGMSSYFFNEFYNSSKYSALKQEVKEAGQLLARYQNGEITLEELWDAVNPEINPDDIFYMLVSENNEVLAYTDQSTAYLADEIVDQLINSLQESNSVTVRNPLPGSMTMMMGERVPSGYVLTGLPMWLVSNSGSYSFYSRLLISMGLGLILVLLLATFSFRKAGKPAQMITEMSARLIQGEQVMLPENLPGQEMQEIAKAMNHMSRSVSTAFQELRYERDITTLTLEGLNEGVVAVDMEGEILHENAAARKLLGDEASPARQAVLSALRDDGEEMQREGKITRDGTILSYSVTHLPAQEAGKFSGRVALIRDITQQERLERTRHDYVANISHELRTPLASIRGLGEGLRDELVTEEKDKQRYYSIIVDEVTRLSRLVNDLLELSSLQSNPAAFEMERIDPNELIYELHDLNGRLFEEKEIAFERLLPEEPLPDICSNEDRLSQVLTIFLDNARKYTRPQGQVWIGAERVESGVRFFVRDTGIGMDEETKRLAFDRFHQAERGRSDKGSGLGLSIAQEILQKMDISIQVDSQPEKGSEFSFIVRNAENSCLSIPE